MLYGFHYPKIMVHVGPALAKETILSKVINMVDGFFINMSQGFDDRQKKYIDTIIKLDNSKTILLESKGGGVTVKNSTPLEWKKGDTVRAEYSEYRDDEGDMLFLDFVGMANIPVDTTFTIGEARLRVTAASAEGLDLVVEHAGKTRKDQLVHFENWDPQLDYLHQKDKKDIQRGFDGGVHMVVASYASSVDHIHEMRSYLHDHDSTKKVIAKIENQKGLDACEDLVSVSDGLIFSRKKLLKYTTDEILTQKIAYAKEHGVPVYLLLDHQDEVVDQKEKHKDLWAQWVRLGIDAFILDEKMAMLDDPLDVIAGLYEHLTDVEFDIPTQAIKPFYEESDRDVIDYILYNVSTVMNDMSIKAIVCYTTTGYTPARLASFRPNVPIIAFTKSDNTYRYMNTLWGVK